MNSVPRRIMEQNSSETDSSVSTSSRRANRRIITFPRERDWFLYFRNSAPQHRNIRRVTSVQYLDELNYSSDLYLDE